MTKISVSWLILLIGLLSTCQKAFGFFSSSFRKSSYSGYVQVRYTRAYDSSYFTTYYRYYFRFYAPVARASGYNTMKSYSNSRECANFEANKDGHYLGFFSCPLSFEPSRSKYCCGVRYSHYCCTNSSWASPIVINSSIKSMFNSSFFIVGVSSMGILVAGGVLWLIGAGFYFCFCNKPSHNRSRVAPGGWLRNGRTIFTTNTSAETFVSRPPPYSGPPPSYQEVGDVVTPPDPPNYNDSVQQDETTFNYPATPPPRYSVIGNAPTSGSLTTVS